MKNADIFLAFIVGFVCFIIIAGGIAAIAGGFSDTGDISVYLDKQQQIVCYYTKDSLQCLPAVEADYD